MAYVSSNSSPSLSLPHCIVRSLKCQLLSFQACFSSHSYLVSPHSRIGGQRWGSLGAEGEGAVDGLRHLPQSSTDLVSAKVLLL